MQTKKRTLAGLTSAAIPIVALIVIILLIGAVRLYRSLPQTYQECLDFPGSSEAEGELTATCTTLYGRSFNKPLFADESTGDEQINSDSFFPITDGSPTPTPQSQTDTKQESDTTKGGLPVATATPQSDVPNGTSKPTTKPTTTPRSDAPSNRAPTGDPANPPTYTGQVHGVHVSGDWLRHSYPAISLKMESPKSFNSKFYVNHQVPWYHVTFYQDNVDHTFAELTRFVGWDGIPEWIRNHSKNYQLPGGFSGRQFDHEGSSWVYFESGEHIYRFRCQPNLWDTCHRMLQTIQLR